MQIKKLEKIYIPMNMQYEEPTDLQDQLETKSSRSRLGFTGIYFNRNKPWGDQIDEENEVVQIALPDNQEINEEVDMINAMRNWKIK